MAKRAKRPQKPYGVHDASGWWVAEGQTLWSARQSAKHCDEICPEDAPHRVYTLVTLEERAVIRAARRIVGQKPDTIAQLLAAFDCLVKAVEAADGK